MTSRKRDTDRQLVANRANAAGSIGPRTLESKARSHRNNP
jgi:hypothetical protein